jgi:hypothetical protein
MAGNSTHTTYRDASGRIEGSGETRPQSVSGTSTRYRDASGRITGTASTTRHPSGGFAGTSRDASGRITGSSTGSGKCQTATKVPLRPTGTKK